MFYLSCILCEVKNCFQMAINFKYKKKNILIFDQNINSKREESNRALERYFSTFLSLNQIGVPFVPFPVHFAVPPGACVPQVEKHCNIGLLSEK